MSNQLGRGILRVPGRLKKIGYREIQRTGLEQPLLLHGIAKHLGLEDDDKVKLKRFEQVRRKALVVTSTSKPDLSGRALSKTNVWNNERLFFLHCLVGVILGRLYGHSQTRDK
jgi:hypothetical protein